MVKCEGIGVSCGRGLVAKVTANLLSWTHRVLHNFILKMSVSYAPTKLSVPPGFEHLLEGLTREVLREQPPNIISFAAQYFRRKLNERPGRLVVG